MLSLYTAKPSVKSILIRLAFILFSRELVLETVWSTLTFWLQKTTKNNFNSYLLQIDTYTASAPLKQDDIRSSIKRACKKHFKTSSLKHFYMATKERTDIDTWNRVWQNCSRHQSGGKGVTMIVFYIFSS